MSDMGENPVETIFSRRILPTMNSVIPYNQACNFSINYLKISSNPAHKKLFKRSYLVHLLPASTKHSFKNPGRITVSGVYISTYSVYRTCSM